MGNVTLSDGNKCPICQKHGSKIIANDINDPLYYYQCENCGGMFVPNSLKFAASNHLSNYYNIHHLRSYLFYNPKSQRPVFCDREYYNKHITEEFVEVYNLSPEMVESWYPHNFSNKIDLILVYLYNQTEYIGEVKTYRYFDLKDIYFVDTPALNEEVSIDRKYREQLDYYNTFLKDNGYIELHSNGYAGSLTWEHKFNITLTPKGLDRVDELQKNQKNNLNVFVAMKFGEETLELREKIKEGLAGFNIRIMDEIEHNHQIVPEMLHEIRNSRFVVAELTHHNNGAYYEAGYALGLGKEVIHICNKNVLGNGLHFDVSQVNTIFYDSVDEIPSKLKRRIEATIT